jgi:hypothetical protein
MVQETARFPLASEVEIPPEMQGWGEMYARYFLFGTTPAFYLPPDAVKAKEEFFRKCLQSFFFHGWDIKTGKPHRQTLVELGLGQLTSDL